MGTAGEILYFFVTLDVLTFRWREQDSSAQAYITDFSIPRNAVWELGNQFSIFQIVHFVIVKVPIEISGSPALIFIPWLFHLYSLVVTKTNQYQTAISYHSQTTIIHPSTISLQPPGQKALLGCLPIHSLSLGERSSWPSRSGTPKYCLIILHLSSPIGARLKEFCCIH